MKMILVLSIIFSSLFSHAGFPSAEVVEQNFKNCQQSVPHWQQNWGQYVIAFDIYAAANICLERPNSSYSRPEMTGCRLNGQWVQAGFYCQEIGN